MVRGFGLYEKGFHLFIGENLLLRLGNFDRKPIAGVLLKLPVIHSHLKDPLDHFQYPLSCVLRGFWRHSFVQQFMHVEFGEGF